MGNRHQLQVQLNANPPGFRNSIANTRANLLQTSVNNIFSNQTAKFNILVLGITGAGKTTFVEFMEKGRVQEGQVKPTIAYERTVVDFGNVQLSFIDVPGQKIYWVEWTKYLYRCDAAIFILDSSRFEYFQIANEIIYQTLELHNFDQPVVFLANKQDRKGSYNPNTIRNMLKIPRYIPNSKVYGISALTGNGIVPAMNWYLRQLKEVSDL